MSSNEITMITLTFTQSWAVYYILTCNIVHSNTFDIVDSVAFKIVYVHCI